jgi:hypothetical protein
LRFKVAEYFQIVADFTPEVVAALKMPVKDGMNRIKSAVETEAKKRGNAIFDFLHANHSYTRRRHALDVLSFSLARMAVAISRYRHETGSFPKRLEDLVPKYLPFVPRDEFSGHPFGYAVRADAAIVYSWGGDGDDDGGRSLNDYSVGDYAEDDGDVVWTVKLRK